MSDQPFVSVYKYDNAFIVYREGEDIRDGYTHHWDISPAIAELFETGQIQFIETDGKLQVMVVLD